ncbi:hypothetical protein TW86_04025 [Halomonas sp. S2151]|uniref:hypothetical protein n=1 Tax=Halomonas sp. S2151 TaxID=579478 RepID=UPI0005FA36A0|nr:hypothetical protein [Halomonas sp. S2151]KJZ17428.1 hypothetical protein TW86_04025 [Halomonas sp. S2151]
MNIKSHTQIQTIFPSFVMHKRWEMPPGFNERLHELACEDAIRNRITKADNPTNIGDTSNHLGHLRHNFLVECQEPEVKTLTQMADLAVREYLASVYGYQHEGEVRMMSDTFWQRRSHGENVGINSHTHIKADLVVTYYPRVDVEPGETSSLRKGACRFYDPANVGKRFWPCNNDAFFVGGWYQLEPQEGSMTVFEGYVPHDSTFFSGEERMCIPILVDVDTPKKHCKAAVSDILGYKPWEKGHE